MQDTRACNSFRQAGNTCSADEKKDVHTARSARIRGCFRLLHKAVTQNERLEVWAALHCIAPFFVAAASAGDIYDPDADWQVGDTGTA